jgi:tight adherence protein C
MFNPLLAMAPLEMLSFIGFGISTGLVVYFFLKVNEDMMQETHDQFGTDVNSELGLLKLFLPTGRIGALWVRALGGEKKGPFSHLVRIMNKVVKQAGQPQGLLGIEVVGMVVINLVLGAVMCLVFIGLLNTSGMMLGILVGAVIMSAILPLLYILDMRTRRQKSIRKSLPYSFDLLCLGVEAGLDFTVAIRRLVEKMGKSSLAQEFAHLLHDLQMGSSRREALTALRQRIDMMDINLFVSALIQADELGAPLAPILKIQSEMLREKRFQRAEELAMKAPVKIIFPLAIFILPVTALVFGVPLYIQMTENFGM